MRRPWLLLCWSLLLLLAAGFVISGVEAQTRHHIGDLPDPRSPKTQYYNAISRGDLAAVMKFINAGMSPNDSMNPLALAARGGHLALVNLLLAEGANPNMPAVGGLSPLRIAAQKGDLAMVQVLLAKGADVNANNPLGEAAWRGHLPVVQALLAKGADVNAKDGLGKTAYIKAEENGHDRTCQVLKQAGAQVDRDDSEAGFLRAAAVGDVARVKDFLAKGMNPNAKDDWGKTALMWAAEKGRLQVVQALLAKGAELNARYRWGNKTALMLAEENGHAEVVKALMQAGAKPEPNKGRGDKGKGPGPKIFTVPPPSPIN